jgi:hypothetical protein
LDAPLVALIWQDCFARTFSVKLDFLPRVVLALAVWLAYAGDRWLDGMRIAEGAAVTPRHRFAQVHRGPIAWVGFAVLGATVLLASLLLPLRFVERGWLLGAGVAIYFFLNQWPKTTRSLRGLKEMAVAILFAAGTVVFVAPRISAAPDSFWLACAEWCLLIVLNCYGIACWEIEADRAEKQESLVTRWPFLARRFTPAALLLAALAVAPVFWFHALARFGLAVAASSLGLAMLDCLSGTLDADFLRTAADLVLFTPLLFGFFSHG